MSNEFTNGLTNRHHAASREYSRQQKKTPIKSVDKNEHFESQEHENKKLMWCCEACGKTVNNKSKASQFISAAHMKTKNNSKNQNERTVEKYVFGDNNVYKQIA